VGATVAAIRSLAPTPGKLILIAGGDGKGADFAPLAGPVAAHCRAVILIGQDATRLADVLDDDSRVVFAGSMNQAVAHAAELAQPGDRVLLSPACASFDMFRGYEDRGQQFVQQVEAL